MSFLSRWRSKPEQPIIYAPDMVRGQATAIPDDVLYDRPLAELTESLDKGSVLFSMGAVPDPDNYSRFEDKLSIVGMRIKQAGDLNHVIPSSCGHLMGTIKTIVDFEAKNSPYFEDKVALLTVRQLKLGQGKSQNNVSWHRDRVGRIYDDEPEYPLTDHIYIVSDIDPTLVQKRVISDAYNKLSSGKAEQDVDYRKVDPYEIILMSNYCHHDPGKMTESGARTFLQLIYTSPSYGDVKKYKEAGNLSL